MKVTIDSPTTITLKIVLSLEELAALQSNSTEWTKLQDEIYNLIAHMKYDGQ